MFRQMGYPLWLGAWMLFLMVLTIGVFLVLSLQPQALEKLLLGLFS